MINLNLGKKLGFAALLAFSATSANAIVLDTFDYGDDDFNLLTIGGAELYQDALNIVPILGNGENTVLNINELGGDVIYDLTSTGGSAGTFTHGGNLEYNNDAAIDSGLNLFYTELTPGGAALDFTQYGDNFYFDVFFVDLAFDATITVFNGDPLAASPDSYSYTRSVSAVDTTVAERNYVNFAEFGATAGFFENITGVNIFFSGDTAVDIIVGEFGVVPEPTTLAIFGLGLIGFAASRKRKA